MHTTRTTKHSERLLCALALLCFMAQQLWAPVHCMLHEHEIGDAGLAQVGLKHCPTHAGKDHFHGDVIIHGDDVDADHVPHPIEDDLTRVVEKLAPRATGGLEDHRVVCLELGPFVVAAEAPRNVGVAWFQVHSAHGPPDASDCPSRGPPLIV